MAVDQIDARDKAAYQLAKEYLLSLDDLGITPEVLESYLRPIEPLRPADLQGVYLRLLVSAQNANMRATVVGRALGSLERLATVLCDFDPHRVVRKYNNGWPEVLDDIERQLAPRGRMRRTPQSIWPYFCRSILSGAVFLDQFSTADEFYSWIQFFDHDDRSRPALPMLLAQEIDGFGFTLACDFLKEMGYFNFAKPDVHVKTIFEGLGLIPAGANVYQVFKGIIRVAQSNQVTPYNADKLFWLIGSGNFYNHRHLGTNGRVRTERNKFIRDAANQLDARTCLAG
jgi:hypothetical protein